MGEIVGLDGTTIDTLAVVIRSELEATGSAYQSLSELAVAVKEWRRVAREVAHTLGRPVQTIVSTDAAHAVLRDWPANEREQRIQEQAIRQVSDALTLVSEVLLPIPPCPACGSERDWHPGARVEQRGLVICPSCQLVEL